MTTDAMAMAIEQINRDADIRDARKARIDADARIVRLRSMRTEPADSCHMLFQRLADGSIAREHRRAALVRARIAQLDFTGTSSPVTRMHLRDAAVSRRQEKAGIEVVVIQPKLQQNAVSTQAPRAA